MSESETEIKTVATDTTETEEESGPKSDPRRRKQNRLALASIMLGVGYAIAAGAYIEYGLDLFRGR